MRYFGMSLQEAEEMTLKEFSWELDAYKHRRQDEVRDMHLQAWLNARVKDTENKGTDKKPKRVPVYKSFDAFYKPPKDEQVTKVSNEKYDSGFLAAMKKANQKALESDGLEV